MRVERRLVDRARQDWQPDPELVRECAGVFEFYGGDCGPMGEDVVRRVLSAAAAWHARKDAEERRHAALRDGFPVGEVLRQLSEVRRRAAEHVKDKE
jgi:hypothetical protein